MIILIWSPRSAGSGKAKAKAKATVGDPKPRPSTIPTHLHPQQPHITPHSYFENVTAGHEWGKHPWPAFFLRAPALPAYETTVPEPRMLSDVAGDGEEPLLPTLERLIDAIIQNRTSTGERWRMQRRGVMNEFYFHQTPTTQTSK